MAKTKRTEDLGLKKDIEYLTKTVEKGFKDIHLRQDIANGKIMKHELQIDRLENKDKTFITKEDYLKNKVDKSDKWHWVIVGMVASIFTSAILLLINAIWRIII